jgi:AP-1-like transcription factor
LLERDQPLVEDLEAKIAACQQKWKNDAEENERLRQQLQNTATENELLKATSTYNSGEAKSVPTSPAPFRYSTKDFYTEVLRAHEKKAPSHRIVTTDSGERLLAAGAVWSYIIQHPLYTRGLVDIGDVAERLKLVARCDGEGPVFEERDIMLAIERSVPAGSGELI